jgi:hypothetical protein
VRERVHDKDAFRRMVKNTLRRKQRNGKQRRLQTTSVLRRKERSSIWELLVANTRRPEVQALSEELVPITVIL